MTANRIAAFFDYDRTLSRKDSQALEADTRFRSNRKDILYVLKLLRVLAVQPFYRRQMLSPHTFNRLYLSSYRGIPLSELEADAERLFSNVIRDHDLIASAIRHLEWHRNQGHEIVIVSATSHHLLAPIARHIAPDHYAATRIETDENGICTGRPKGSVLVGTTKREFVFDHARTHGIDLARSFAYSDHHADLPFLEAVGNPVAANPDKGLEQEARRRGWPVRHFK